MNLDLALVLLVLAAAIVMFVINRPRMDAVIRCSQSAHAGVGVPHAEHRTRGGNENLSIACQ